MESGPINAMSVDVEDYFQVSAFEKTIRRSQWDHLPCRVEENTGRILELFDAHGSKATFFMLGWIAERYPRLVRRIVDEGHELACHGYQHIRVSEQTPAQFQGDVSKSKNLLEQIAGVKVRGYRAASYSISKQTLWALDILEQLGFAYSSSIYPGHHDSYGIPEAPRFPFRPCSAEGLLEIPVTTVELGGVRYPCGGGGFFRLYPYLLTRWAIRQVNARDGQSCVFYFHPWEIDPGQPRQTNIGLKTRLRHYLNLGRMEPRLHRLLADFRWHTLARVFIDVPADSASG